MNANQCADYLEVAIGGRITGECADILRRQHEAIKVLREALIDCLDDSRQAVCDYEVTYGEHFRPQRLAAMRKTVADAEAALAATENVNG